MKMAEKILYPIIFLFIILGVIFSRVNLQFYEGTYTVEDGIIEWLTVLALFSSAVMCFYRAYILRPFREKIFIFFLVFLGLLFCFGVGEEISWGQRIFGIKSPQFFVENNSQQELNFHNLVVSGTKINKLVFGLILGIGVVSYLLIFPFLFKKFQKFKTFINKFAIPIPRWYHIVLYILLAVLAEFIEGGKKGEILEFGGCWIFFLLGFNPYNREIFSRKSFNR